MKTTIELKKTGKIKLALLPALGMIALLLPKVAGACPLCVDSTPYKHGLQWAVAFLLPVPFVLAGTLIWWVRRHLPSDQE